MVISFNSYGQLGTPQPKFKNFTVDDGLPGSEAYFVHQDKKGYIWICTDHGVARYDGNKFKKFTTADGLTDNVVFSIYEDYKGRIWFITYNSELCYLEKEKIHKYKYNKLILEKGNVRIVTQKKLYIDSSDNLFISIKGNGILKINKYGASKSISCRNNMQISKIGNELFWGFEHIDYSFHFVDSVDLVSILKGKKERISSFSTRGRISTTNNNKGDYILADDELFDLQTNKKVLNEKGAISIQSLNDELWIGTFKNGVRYFPKINDTSISYRFLKGYSVSSILRDQEGGYWFTTLEKGLFYTPYISIKSYTVKEGLFDNNIASIGGLRENIYMGFLLGKWQSLNDKNDLDTTKIGNAHTVIGSSKHKVYISTKLSEYRVKKPTYSIWSSDYYTEENSVIFGARWIFRKHDNGKLDFLYNHLLDSSPHKTNIIESIMIDKEGCLWVGSISGLRYIKNNYTYNNGLNDPLFKVRVSDLESNALWKNIVATRGEGIYFFKNKKIFKQITIKNGLLSNFVNVLYVDEHNGIWVGSNKGLNYITQDAKGKIRIDCYTTLHGLCSNEITSVYYYDKVVYVATKEGLSIIDVKNFQRNKKKTKIFVTSISTGSENYNASYHHIFNHQESYIKILFRNTNYRSLQHGFYKYWV